MTIVSFFMNSKEVLVTFAAVIGAITAMVGSCVAVKGLNIWRRQISGQSNHNLSKSLLISAFKYRDAISVLRHPFMPSYEMIMPEKEKAQMMSVDALLNHGRVKGYQARWEKVREAHALVYANLIEAEALWGKDLSEIWKSIRMLENSLFVALDSHLRYSGQNERNDEKNERSQCEISRLIFSQDENDDFKNELNELLSKFEDYVRVKMKI